MKVTRPSSFEGERCSTKTPYTPQVGDIIEVMCRGTFKGSQLALVFEKHRYIRRGGYSGVVTFSSVTVVRKLGAVPERFRSKAEAKPCIASILDRFEDTQAKSPTAPPAFKVGDTVKVVSVSFGAPRRLIGMELPIVDFTESGSPKLDLNNTHWCVSIEDIKPT